MDNLKNYYTAQAETQPDSNLNPAFDSAMRVRTHRPIRRFAIVALAVVILTATAFAASEIVRSIKTYDLKTGEEYDVLHAMELEAANQYGFGTDVDAYNDYTADVIAEAHDYLTQKGNVGTISIQKKGVYSVATTIGNYSNEDSITDADDFYETAQGGGLPLIPRELLPDGRFDGSAVRKTDILDVQDRWESGDFILTYNGISETELGAWLFDITDENDLRALSASSYRTPFGIAAPESRDIETLTLNGFDSVLTGYTTDTNRLWLAVSNPDDSGNNVVVILQSDTLTLSELLDLAAQLK